MSSKNQPLGLKIVENVVFFIVLAVILFTCYEQFFK
jgi:hypothetical protein